VLLHITPTVDSSAYQAPNLSRNISVKAQEWFGYLTQVRELFVMAREHAPSIIFMDEIDSIGSSRGDGGGSSGGDSEVQRTMLELLNQLDGFEATQSIKVIMATNRIDILDSALLRPGTFF
jgi:ATP-dependent 26S proteasome regulatory subunit